ncbi:MAG: hypothetical protein WDW38_007727 [Sanguina aurantia]
MDGLGCVPIHHLMEDAATAEMASQVWQWVKHSVRTKEGKLVTPELVATLLDEEAAALRQAMGEKRYSASKYELAKKELLSTVQGKEYSDFLTSLCYRHIMSNTGRPRM